MLSFPLSSLWLLAQDEPGRGGDPDGGLGVLVIIGVILLAALVVGAVIRFAIARTRKTAPGDGTPEGEHDRGQVGRL